MTAPRFDQAAMVKDMSSAMTAAALEHKGQVTTVSLSALVSAATATAARHLIKAHDHHTDLLMALQDRVSALEGER